MPLPCGINLKQVLGEVEESPDDAHEHEEVLPEQREKENEEKRKALYDIMSCMRDIRKRTERTDAMFEPLRATVAVLNGFGIALPETVLQQLENAGEWRGVGGGGSWRMLVSVGGCCEGAD